MALWAFLVFAALWTAFGYALKWLVDSARDARHPGPKGRHAG